jgi:predicted Fe-Mo cluster-binding NifX family protein
MVNEGGVMKYRIAVATKDGKVVFEHFGHCKKFSIVEVENNDFRFIGFREVEPPCNGGEHAIDALVNAVERLKDCSYVVVGQIGMGAQQILSEHQIMAYVFKGLVMDALSDIVGMKGR